jgi:hypothetical protein
LKEWFMKIAVTLHTCLAISLNVAAAPKLENEVKTGIADTVERYANSISCRGITVKPEDVLTLAPYKDDQTPAKYAVLWTGDLGCFGGSGTEGTRLAIATVNTGQYVVQPELSSPAVAFESPVRFISRVFSHSADLLVLEGKEYEANDPRSNPSVLVRFTLRVDAKGNWRLTDKVRIVPEPQSM